MTTLMQLGRWWRRARAREATAATALLLVIAFGAPPVQRALLGPEHLLTSETRSPREIAQRPAPAVIVPLAPPAASAPSPAAAPLRRLTVANHGLPAPRAPDRR